jgi:hypothetical protein
MNKIFSLIYILRPNFQQLLQKPEIYVPTEMFEKLASSHCSVAVRKRLLFAMFNKTKLLHPQLMMARRERQLRTRSN